MTNQKVKLKSNEKVQALPFPKTPRGMRYAITNYGRIISYTKEIEDGSFLKGATVSGYPAISFRVKGENKTFLTHRLVAKYFVRQTDRTHKYVIHLNHKKDDNFFQNLRWATYDQQIAHRQTNNRINRIGNFKLTAERVVLIKKRLATGKTRLKTLAKQFGVTDMQIHRIKTGENWGHVKV
jgi:hypothetical protein